MGLESTQMHTREHKSLLAANEKRVLVWLAHRTPGFVNSDHLTVFGFAGMLLAGSSYWASSVDRRALLCVVLGLVINWYGDSLDGTLARVRNKQRPRYGYYTDHVLDLLGTSVLFGGLSASGFMSPMIGMGVMCAYFIVSAEVFLATHARRVFRLSSLMFGPTELRLLLAAGTLYLLHSPRVRLAGYGPFLLFDLGGIVAIVGLALAFFSSAGRNIAALYREEPLVD